MKELLKSLKKLLKDIKVIINKIKRFLDKPLTFLRDGKLVSSISLGIISGYFLYGWKIYSVIKTIPHFILILLGIGIVFIVNELFNYIFKLICKFDIRSITYFITTFCLLFVNNIVANHRHLPVEAFITCFILTSSFYLFSNTIGVIIKRKGISSVGIYATLMVSLIGTIFSLNFLLSPNITSKKVLNENTYETLKNGKYKVETVYYGENKDLKTKPVDLSSLVKRFGIKNKITNITSRYNYKKTDISGAIWYPKNKDNNETLFIVHGATSYIKGSYLGFDYLGEFLASHGYTVVSINEDIINELDTKNDVRTVLLLENIKEILKENNNKDSIIYNKINEEKLALLGHSRGGEVVSLAYLFNNLKNHPDNKDYKFDYNFNITSLIALAPTVDQYLVDKKSISLEDVNYLLMHGSNDGDISKVMGEKTYNNITLDKENYFKAELYIKGANHGQFNSKWSKYDSEIGANPFINTKDIISKEDELNITKVYVKTFLDCTLKDNTKNISLFKDNSSYKKYLPNISYINRYMDSSYNIIEDFDDDIKNITFNNFNSHNIYKDNMGNGKDKENKVLELKYDKTSYLDIKLDNQNVDSISFDIADKRFTDVKDNIKYKVILTDKNDNIISVINPKEISKAYKLQLYKEDILFKKYEYRSQMQSVILSKEMFKAKDFDFKNVKNIRIEFDETKDGIVILDNISIIG